MRFLSVQPLPSAKPTTMQHHPRTVSEDGRRRSRSRVAEVLVQDSRRGAQRFMRPIAGSSVRGLMPFLPISGATLRQLGGVDRQTLAEVHGRDLTLVECAHPPGRSSGCWIPCGSGRSSSPWPECTARRVPRLVRLRQAVQIDPTNTGCRDNPWHQDDLERAAGWVDLHVVAPGMMTSATSIASAKLSCACLRLYTSSMILPCSRCSVVATASPR